MVFVDQDQTSIIVQQPGKYILLFDHKDGICNTVAPVPFEVTGVVHDVTPFEYNKDFYCVGDDLEIKI